MIPLPLEGITVVSLEQAVAAPFASRQLADLGARVIKIERPSGDFARGYDDRVRGMSSYFVWLNRNKESVVLDVKSEVGAEALRRLIQRADVFIQNLAPGALERMGLGPDDAMRMNPKLVYVSISGYGRGGGYSQKKAYDLLIQCEAGLLSVTGTAEAPAKVGVSIADISAGMYAYSGTLAALINRSRTGRGEAIEISMLEALGEWMSQPYLFAEYGGYAPARSGAQHPSIAPYGPFSSRDGTVFFGIQNEREWASFCHGVLGDEQIASDPRFQTNTARVKNRGALHELIDRVIGNLSSDDVQRRLDSADIANARLRGMSEFSSHPQLADRGRWQDVDSESGPIRSMLSPITAGWRARMDGVPGLGQHTDEILGELGLGIADTAP